MKYAVLILLISGAPLLAQQLPNPVRLNTTPNPNGTEPIFTADVTSRTVMAVNYHNRQGTTHIDFRGTALMPAARGEAGVTANTGATRISLKFDHLSNPRQFGPEYLTYVLWAVTPQGQPERLGEVTLKHPDDKTAGLYVTTDLQSFGMIVTAEPYFAVSRPSDVVVMENVVRKSTVGTLETVQAKYELLRRGDYTANISGGALTAVTSDLAVPLELREAREAMAIAKAQGAQEYAPDVLAKAAADVQNADGYYRTHQQKELDTVAREATQDAEDARRISVVKEGEAAAEAAKRRTEQAEAEAAEQARLRAQADAQREAAEKAKNEAEIATAQALTAKREADEARQAAVAQQQQLAEETAAAKAERAKAEQEAQALRERLRAQLNAILQTRDTARGLIVSMSDVLFGFNQATLKPDAKEKLAKVSGILLAYPTLHVNVEGYTDNIGSDTYNLKLSQQRADAVRDYLISNGINPAYVESLGMGEADPVASNDTAAGRQQNRRVELVVSGDVIGQPIGPNPSGSLH